MLRLFRLSDCGTIKHANPVVTDELLICSVNILCYSSEVKQQSAYMRSALKLTATHTNLDNAFPLVIVLCSQKNECVCHSQVESQKTVTTKASSGKTSQKSPQQSSHIRYALRSEHTKKNISKCAKPLSPPAEPPYLV